MVGALIGSGQLALERMDVENEIKTAFPPKRIELNLKALEMGLSTLS